ncbi:MAG: BhlA/UviB family holin-like peptide [Clostridium sp.]|nr:BhlA/UviB family holin-like peptide [Clostridium sp.]
MEELIKLITENGVVVVAFVWLLKYTLDTATAREQRLMDFMDKMKDELKNLSEATHRIASDLEDVKDDLKNIKDEK